MPFQLLLALLAGIVTIGGPCILPLLPIVLGTSAVGRHPLRPVAITGGFIVAFSGLNLLFAAFGQALGLAPSTWRVLSAVLIGVFGLLLLAPRLQTVVFARLEGVAGTLTPRDALQKNDLASGVLLGVSLGAVWAPCAGPVLGSILTLAASQRDFLRVIPLLFAFSLGAGIPMLLIGYGGHVAVQRVRALAPHTATIQRLFGVLILLTAIGLLTHLDTRLLAFLLDRFPWLFPALRFTL